MPKAKSQKSLDNWTEQDWGTKSGKPSAKTGERYLPKKAIAALSDSEYKATSDKKRKDTAAGKQHSPQTKKARRVARQFRNIGGPSLTYNQKYHKDTIEQGKVMINEKGQPVTANVIGIEYNNKIYNVPSYNRQGGFYSEDEARENFKEDIEKGLIKGYDKKFDGPIEKHPANVAARLEHQMMDIDGEKISPESIAYNLLKVK